MLLPLVLLFVAVPIAEIFLLIQVGQAIGAWWTIAILVADSIVGAVLLRLESRAAWQRFGETMRAGRVPAREVIDGALVIAGGVLLLTPGFLTDALGLLLLLPPTRAVVRAIVARRLAHRMVASVTTARSGPRPGHDFDVEGTAIDVDSDRLPPHRAT
jgi:UPF0716 protein FxsA